jgi:hypothetical protein
VCLPFLTSPQPNTTTGLASLLASSFAASPAHQNPPSTITTQWHRRGNAVPAQSQPRLSLLSLPDIAHDNIAFFLPESSDDKDSRLRVAEASHALLEAYGGSRNWMHIRFLKGSGAGRLAALLRRQKKLAHLFTSERKSLPALCHAIAQGCCRTIKVIDLFLYGQRPLLTEDRVSVLAGAIETNGALPMLKRLSVGCPLTFGSISKLARALAAGTAPEVQELCFDTRLKRVDESGPNGEDLDSIADMLEARARIPGCKKLQYLGMNYNCFDRASLATQLRLLRLLLPSVKTLPSFNDDGDGEAEKEEWQEEK